VSIIEQSDLITIIGKGKYQVCGCTGGKIALLDFQKPNSDGSYELSISKLPDFWIKEWGVPPNQRLQPTPLSRLCIGGALLFGIGFLLGIISF
jgi:hypothetical protein